MSSAKTSIARRLGIVNALTLGLALGGCGSSSSGQPDLYTAPSPDLTMGSAGKDIVATAVGAGNFKTLVAAATAAGLAPALSGPGPLTVFAPTDDAFGKVPAFLTAKLVTAPYKGELGLILKYHVLGSKVLAADVLNKKQDVTTLAGAKLNVDGSGGKVVLSGGVNVTTPDVLATNGVIHVIDGVLLPTLVDTAVNYDDGTTKFSALAGAATAAGLIDTLNGAGPFTVFAPSDAAFAALKAGLGDATFNAIVADKAKVAKILTYHVLAGAVFSPDVKGGAVTTVQGGKITLTVAGGKVTIADSTQTAANVVLTDIPARNGVIHVIDKVLLPAGL